MFIGRLLKYICVEGSVSVPVVRYGNIVDKTHDGVERAAVTDDIVPSREKRGIQNGRAPARRSAGFFRSHHRFRKILWS